MSKDAPKSDEKVEEKVTSKSSPKKRLEVLSRSPQNGFLLALDKESGNYYLLPYPKYSDGVSKRYVEVQSSVLNDLLRPKSWVAEIKGILPKAEDVQVALWLAGAFGLDEDIINVGQVGRVAHGASVKANQLMKIVKE